MGICAYIGVINYQCLLFRGLGFQGLGEFTPLGLG